jgi:hypothetical protein
MNKSGTPRCVLRSCVVGLRERVLVTPHTQLFRVDKATMKKISHPSDNKEVIIVHDKFQDKEIRKELEKRFRIIR